MYNGWCVEEGEKREAVHELGRALVRSGQARRAAHLLRKHNAHLHDARSLLLAATALLEVKVRATLDTPSRDPQCALRTGFIQPTDHNDRNLTWGGTRVVQDLAAGLELLPEGFEAPQHGLSAGLHGALHLARGKLLDAADQPALAATAYQRALLQVWSPISLLYPSALALDTGTTRSLSLSRHVHNRLTVSLTFLVGPALLRGPGEARRPSSPASGPTYGACPSSC